MFTIVYFSPTGNAKYVAEKLAERMDLSSSDVRALEFTAPEQLKPNKHLVLIHPVHGFNAPRNVKRFVKDLPEKRFETVSLLAVGCTENWMNAAVSVDLKKHLLRKAYAIAVDELIAMPLTFITNFPENLNIELLSKSEHILDELHKALVSGKVTNRTVAAKSKVLNFLGKGESPAARLFGLELHANTHCDSCGICWNNCPVKNIRAKDGSPKFGFKCLMCMRCIYTCPQRAISPRFSKFIPIKNGYSLSKYLTIYQKKTEQH